MAQRVALVTGGMGGLGEAICMKLERMGVKVIVTYSPGNTKHGEWLKSHGGKLVPARKKLGDAKHKPSQPAPGSFAKERL